MGTALLLALSLSTQLPPGSLELAAAPLAAVQGVSGAFSPDGTRLVLVESRSGGERLSVFATDTQRLERVIETRIGCRGHVSFSRDSQRVACGVAIYELGTGASSITPLDNGEILLLTAPDGERVIGSEPITGRTTLFDRRRPHLRDRLDLPRAPLQRQGLHLTADGTVFMYPLPKGGLYIYDARRGRGRVVGKGVAFRHPRLSNSGRVVAVTISDWSVFDRRGRRLLHGTAEAHAGHLGLTEVAGLSEDGRRLVVATVGRTGRQLLLFDVDTGEQLRRVPLGKARMTTGVVLSPDARSAVVLPTLGGATMWDLTSGEPRAGDDALPSPVHAFAFSSARALVAVAAGADTFLFDQRGQRVQRIEGATGDVVLGFSRDGTQLVVVNRRTAALFRESRGKFVLVSQIGVAPAVRAEVTDDASAVWVDRFRGERELIGLADGRVLERIQRSGAAPRELPTSPTLADMLALRGQTTPVAERNGLTARLRRDASVVVERAPGATSLVQLPSAGTSVALSDDGHWLAVGGAGSAWLVPVAALEFDAPPHD